MAWLQSLTSWLAPEEFPTTEEAEEDRILKKRDLHADLHQRERVYIGSGSSKRVRIYGTVRSE
eukprot:1192318-Prorocentrum_minimum.AAC.4